MVSAARAAKPPLSPSLRARPRPGLLLVFDGEDAIADGQRFFDGQVHQRARRFVGDDVEMIAFRRG